MNPSACESTRIYYFKTKDMNKYRIYYIDFLDEAHTTIVEANSEIEAKYKFNIYCPNDIVTNVESLNDDNVNDLANDVYADQALMLESAGVYE